MAAADDKSSTSDKVSTSSAGADPREAWWPLAVAVAWVLLRSQQVVEQLLNRHARKPVTFTIVAVYAAKLRAGGQHPKFENSAAAFDALRHPLETGEIEIVGTPFVRVGDLSSARLEMGKQQPILSAEMSSLVRYDDHGELCLIPGDWRVAHGSTRTNLRGWRNVLVRSVQLTGRFPEEEQLAHRPPEAVVREKMGPEPVVEAPAPAPAPAPPRKVSEDELRGCILDIVINHPPDTAPPAEKTLITMVESQLGVLLPRDRFRQALKNAAPHFKRPRGRARKSAQ